MFRHPALFYSGIREYLEGTVPPVQEALAGGWPAAVAVPGRNLKYIRDALGSVAESVLWTDMEKTGANPGRILPDVLLSFADAHRGRRVLIVGEPVWPGRTELEYPACAQHEALVNLAFAGREATVLCAYDVEGLEARTVEDARATHSALIDRKGFRASEWYDPGRVIADYNRPLPPAPRSAVRKVVDLDGLEEARRFSTAHGRRAGLTAHQLVDLDIVATELLANSIAHGGGTGVLRLWTDEPYLICEVSDAGHITDPLAGRLPAEDDEDRGQGLLLVNRVADLVRVHSDSTGTAARAHLRLPAGGA